MGGTEPAFRVHINRSHGVGVYPKRRKSTENSFHIDLWRLLIIFGKGENMDYKLNISSLATQVVEVKQFEHNVTRVTATFNAEDIHEDLIELTPCILLSFGEKITKDNGLSYIVADTTAGISWWISQECTQKAGTYFAQFAFIDKDETIKAYTDKFIFKVLPSVDIQKAVFEYKPRFLETFWNKIVAKISEMLPKKVSELENDADYISTTNTLSEYAKTTEVNKALESYSTTAEIDEKLAGYATHGDTTSEIYEFYRTREALYTATCNVPHQVKETTMLGMTFIPDPTSTYFQSILIDKFSDLTNFKVSEFIINIYTMEIKSTVSATVRVEVNVGSSGSGILVFTNADVLVNDEPSNAFISYRNELGIPRVKYSRLKTNMGISPISSKCRYLGITTPPYIKNIKITFVPTDPTAPTTNFLSNFQIKVSGKKIS